MASTNNIFQKKIIFKILKVPKIFGNKTDEFGEIWGAVAINLWPEKLATNWLLLNPILATSRLGNLASLTDFKFAVKDDLTLKL